MNLMTLQNDFRAWLETGSDAAAARFAPEAQAGLLVYQNNYRASLMACLEESFPRTLAWIGDEAFQSVAARLIDARPPDSWSLDHYATHFPPALGEAFPQDPEVSEIATLELALTNAFVGPDCEALVVADLSHIDWDRAMVRWVPTAELLHFGTNAADIWSALSVENSSQAIAQRQSNHVLVWRHQETSCFRALDTLEAECAPLLFGGIGFADLCSRLVVALGQEKGIQTAGLWLGRWAADGLVVTMARQM